MMRLFGKSSNDEDTAKLAPDARRVPSFPWARLALLGLAAYGAALIGTIPARLVAGDALPSAVTGISGTIWNGEATLAGGHVAQWHLSALDSLLNLSAAADWTLSGPSTDLKGRAVVSRGSLVLSDVDGRTGWPLVTALAPRLAAGCDVTVRVDIQTLALGAGPQTLAGTLRSPPGKCVFTENGVTRTTELPALLASASAGAVARIVEAERPESVWAEVQLLPDRRVALTWYAPSIAFASGAQSSGPVMLEFGF